ncbi:zinc finger-containing protein [Cryptosporidium canis]|uniref:Zinc finger-containing protein n=1 Tax=Cryptosporidium canis TaxID=195482 RepID=A0ABQ8P2P4_9CRYT|nr:zinc finger-containing protein [Cryptosporidium canis]KAJ1612000.1 zinc finger-containing protein [Cryptosporidium canis]
MASASALCTVCGCKLESTGELREHYKTEWHSYNQKRKLANKEPVSEAVFRRKLELLEYAKMQVDKGNSHLKNKQKAESQAKSAEGESVAVMSDRPRQSDTYQPTYCYFDSTIHPSMHECFEYMKTRYSFIIPDREYLVDQEGLAQYLGEKLFEGHICLYCDRVFSSLRAVRDHMISLGHTMLGTHLDIQREELEGFYNYSSSYKELIPNLSKMSISDQGAQDDDEWEYIDEDDDLQEHESGQSGRNELFLDEILTSYNLRRPEITQFGDLRLPNGKEVVHRDLAYIYKQRVPNKQPAESTDGSSSLVLNSRYHTKRIQVYSNRQPAVNIRFKDQTHLKQNLLLSKRIKNSNLKVGVNNNKLQKYFMRRDIVW